MRLTFLSPILVVVAMLGAWPAAGQFTGPGQSGKSMTVSAAVQAPVGTHVTLTGRILAH